LFADQKLLPNAVLPAAVGSGAECSFLRPPILDTEASDILRRYLSAALRRLSPETAMKAAANETRRLLGLEAEQVGQ